MVKFFRDVMGMQPIRDEPEIAGFQLTNGTQVELYRPEEAFHAFFTTGPVVAFWVDDVHAARATMQAAGIAQSWRTNRAQAYQQYQQDLERYQQRAAEGNLDAQAQTPVWREWNVPSRARYAARR